MKNKITKTIGFTTVLILSTALVGCGSTPAASTNNSTPTQGGSIGD